MTGRMPHVEIPEYRSVDDRRIPLDDVQRAALSRGDGEDGDLRYASLGDLIVKLLGPSSIETEDTFDSLEQAVMRTAAIEIKAIVLSAQTDGEIEGPSMILDTRVSDAERALLLDALASRLEAASELCARLREFRQPEQPTRPEPESEGGDHG